MENVVNTRMRCRKRAQRPFVLIGSLHFNVDWQLDRSELERWIDEQ
jgi:hypothetical protein